jgi:hypothetical protein
MRGLYLRLRPKLTIVTLSRCAAVLALCGLLTACSLGESSFSPPNPSDPGVRQEEARIAAVLVADTSGELLDYPHQGPAHCKVQLLRKVGSTDYVNANCTAGDEGAYFPVRLVGRTITVPGDGNEYAASIRRIFPSDIAAWLFEGQN